MEYHIPAAKFKVISKRGNKLKYSCSQFKWNKYVPKGTLLKKVFQTCDDYHN